MVDVLVKEGAARHAGHADLLRHLDAELYVRLALFHIGRDIGQHKISALGVCKGDIEVFHAAGEDSLHMGVVVSKLAVVFIWHLEAHNSGLHQRRSRADGVKVVVLLDPVHDGLRSDRVAEPPAGNGVGLRQARTADRPLPHAGKRGHVDHLPAIVDNVLIDLVHDGIDVILDAELRNKLQLLIGKDLAAGVRGVADEDGLRVLPERVLQDLRVKMERRGNELHENRLAVRHNGLRAVVFKIRREHDDLVARVRERKNGVDHSLGRADGHDDVRIRVNGNAHEPAALAADRAAEIRRAHRDWVLVRALLADLAQPVGHGLRGIKVREALRQIDRAAVKAHTRHPANDGVGKMLVSSAHFLHAAYLL